MPQFKWCQRLQLLLSELFKAWCEKKSTLLSVVLLLQLEKCLAIVTIVCWKIWLLNIALREEIEFFLPTDWRRLVTGNPSISKCQVLQHHY